MDASIADPAGRAARQRSGPNVFSRVEIESGETAKFRGSVAGDLVHLLAELIENATNFSPPDTSVVVRYLREQGLDVIED